MLYKYPQEAFPYEQLIDENHRRGRDQGEYELLDTGIFNENRYFDVLVEYAKAGPQDLLMLVTVFNRGDQDAPLHVIPQLWFRNTWSWGRDHQTKPALTATSNSEVLATHAKLGEYHWYADGPDELLFCDNQTDTRKLFGLHCAEGYFKDAFHECLVAGKRQAVNPARTGTKAAAVWQTKIPAQGSRQIRLRLTNLPATSPFADFDNVFADRRREADAFYTNLQHDLHDAEVRNVQRQALAGMIWCKQFYRYDVPEWLSGDPGQPTPPPERKSGRNHEWLHLNNADIISMPDKWEYPWYAAWDLAFHCIPLSLVDAEFAKAQLVLLAREWYMHPNGQLPAYEWAFGDVNPPVHALGPLWRVSNRSQTARRSR